MRHAILAAAIAGIVTALVGTSAESATFSTYSNANVWVTGGGGGQASTLRAWGSAGNAVDAVVPPGSGFSYGYLGFDVSSIPAGSYIVTSAKLTVTETRRSVRYAQAVGNANPLEVRELNQFVGLDANPGTHTTTVNPSTILGLGSLVNYVPGAPGSPATTKFTIPVNLLSSGNFQSYFNSAVNGDQQLSLALTSTLDVSVNGIISGEFYRIYSGNELGFETDGPLLEVEYALVPEPGTWAVLLTGLASAVPALRRRKA